MSTGTETVSPSADHENPGTATDASATAATTAPEFVDMDDAELQQAVAAAQAEEAASPQAAAGTDAQPQQAKPAAPQGTEPQPAPIMIPKVRLDEALAAKQKAEQEAAYYRGQAEARATAPPPQGGQPQAPQPPQLTAEQRLTQIAAANEQLAKQFDDGEITMAEYKRQERTLAQQENQIRDQQLLAKVPQAPKSGTDELYLETLTAQLEEKHPWVPIFDQAASEADWKYVKDRATENLVARGIDPRNGALGVYELRKEMSALCDALGPTLVGARAQARGLVLPGTQQRQQQPPQTPQLSPAAQARQAALAKAAGAPPDIHSMVGHTGPADGSPTDASILAMDEDAIGALTPHVRNKLLGIST